MAGQVIEVTQEAQLETLAHLVSSENVRVVSLNHDDRILEEFTPVGACDTLRVSNVQRIVPPETFLHKALLAAIFAATSRKQVVDGRRGGIDTVEDLASKFIRAAQPRAINLAQNRYEHLAYVEREMVTNRFLVHDVAEQLMLYKRDNKAGYLVVDDFLHYCREQHVLGDVVLGMMIYKLYRKRDDERQGKYEEFAINARVIDEIERVFSYSGGGDLKLEQKQSLFLKLAGSPDVQQGSLDKVFLSLVSVEIRKAIIFTFKSLYGFLYEKFRNNGSHDATNEQLSEQVLEATNEFTDAPQEYMLLTSPMLTNLVIPFQREWMKELSSLSPPALLGAILANYSQE